MIKSQSSFVPQGCFRQGVGNDFLYPRFACDKEPMYSMVVLGVGWQSSFVPQVCLRLEGGNH